MPCRALCGLTTLAGKADGARSVASAILYTVYVQDKPSGAVD